MRSLLIAQADQRRLAEALKSGADAIIVDLAGAQPSERAAARAVAARFLEGRRERAPGRLIVKVNPLDSGETDADLDAAMAHAPDAILLPRSFGAASVHELSAKLAVREANFALADGGTRIIAVVDTAQALFAMGSYRRSSARLIGIAWSPESLRAETGAETDPSGRHGGPCRLARDLTLFAAASAGVAAIDAAFADPGDDEGLCAEALAARRDGFAGKMAIEAAQAGVINAIFPTRAIPLALS